MDENYPEYTASHCQHWTENNDCDEMCACGHVCRMHVQGEGCKEDDCECVEFRDPDEAKVIDGN